MSDQPRSTRDTLESEAQRATDAYESLHRDYEEATADPDVIQEDRNSARTLAEQARLHMEAANAALAKFDQGGYGICEKCGKQIPAERLEAIPDATACRDCSV